MLLSFIFNHKLYCTLALFDPLLPFLQSGSPVNGILHLSDLHWDSQYTPGLSNDCGEPLCCRPPNKPGQSACLLSQYTIAYNYML